MAEFWLYYVLAGLCIAALDWMAMVSLGRQPVTPDQKKAFALSRVIMCAIWPALLIKWVFVFFQSFVRGLTK